MILGMLGALAAWYCAAICTISAGGYTPVHIWPEDWRYFDSNSPMISSADGFYFLYQAWLVTENGVSGAPALSVTTAALAGLFFDSLENAAFYTSLIFYIGLGGLVALWGRILNFGKLPVFLASLAMGLMPAWVERAGPGRFDTDLPIALFWQIGIFLLVLAARKKDDGRIGIRPLFLAGAVVSFAVLFRFWFSGLGLGLGTLALWAFLLPPGKRWNVKIRIVTGMVLLAWLLAVMFMPLDKTPAPAILIELVKKKMGMALGLLPDLVFTSIKELVPLSPADILEKIGGNIPGGLLVLISGAVLCITKPLTRLPLIIAFVSLLASLKADRLLYLGSFPLAMAIGFFPALAREFVDRHAARLPKRPAALAGLMLTLAALYGYAQYNAHRTLDIRWTRGQDRLACELRDTAPAGAKLWNWWDDGHFLAARTRTLKPFFDGGSISAVRAYIAARPYTMSHPRIAARWMRFFALRGEEGIYPLAEAFGWSNAWYKLEYLLNVDNFSPEQVEAARKDIVKLPGGFDWLFPEGEVYWYMPATIFKISAWWVALGASLPPKAPSGRPHIEAIGQDKFRYDPQSDHLTITQDLWDRGYTSFGAVVETDTWNTLSLQNPKELDGKREPFIFSSRKSQSAFIVDRVGAATLPVSMMLHGGQKRPGYRPVIVDPKWGGVWEVPLRD